MTTYAPIVVKRDFPWTDTSGSRSVTFRLMHADDKQAIIDLAMRQSERDRAFLRTDVTNPAVVDEWIANIHRGRTVTVLAEVDHRIIGYGSLHHDETMWTSHMGEIRVLVDPDFRGESIAKRLVAELFHIALEMKLERVYVQIPTDQARVRNLFEELGFQSEAILNNWLLDADGVSHDMLIMTHAMDDFGGR
jgi:N-acetylglutamate synthase-like GNAT family acetyltransferase